jgi:hypothetical protein
MADEHGDPPDGLRGHTADVYQDDPVDAVRRRIESLEDEVRRRGGSARRREGGGGFGWLALGLILGGGGSE